MSPWRHAVEDYIPLRRSLGFKLCDAKVALSGFASFLEASGAAHLTIALALQWAQQDPAARPAAWARRLSVVRGFARHWSAQDPHTEVPPWGLLPHRPGRPRPYPYSDDEVRRLLQAAQIQRVLAIPGKRTTRALISFLTRPEIDALLAAPDPHTWFGRRDHALLLVAVQTGLRVSELTSLQRADVAFGAGAHVRCLGKGRKERCTPLTKTTVAVLKAWLREPARRNTATLFPSAQGGQLSRDSVADLLAKHVARASQTCHSLRSKRVTPHVLPYQCDPSIACWRGHQHDSRLARPCALDHDQHLC